MRRIEWKATFTEYQAIEELPSEIQNLMLRAEEAREKAYAPYSKFNVGAAVLLENGEIVAGSNQENGAFPSGLCAERIALFAAGANFPGIPIAALCITARPESIALKKPIAPCGGCRQVMAETEARQPSAMRIFFRGSTGPIVEAAGTKSLMPYLFKFGDWE